MKSVLAIAFAIVVGAASPVLPSPVEGALKPACGARPDLCDLYRLLLVDDLRAFIQGTTHAIHWEHPHADEVASLLVTMTAKFGSDPSAADALRTSLAARLAGARAATEPAQPTGSDLKWLGPQRRPDDLVNRIARERVEPWCRHLARYLGSGWCNSTPEDLAALAQASGLMSAEETDRVGWGQPSAEALHKAEVAQIDGEKIRIDHALHGGGPSD